MELIKEALGNIIAKLDKLSGVVSQNKKKESEEKDLDDAAKNPENVLGTAMNEENEEDESGLSKEMKLAHEGNETPQEEAAEEVAVHGEGDVPEEDQGNEDPLEAIFKRSKMSKNA